MNNADAALGVETRGRGVGRISRSDTRVTQWRGALTMGCAALGVGIVHVTEPAAWVRADPELARLLRSMAVLKILLVALTFAAVWWRLGRALSLPLGVSYLIGVWAMAGCCALLWQFQSLSAVAVAFHLAGALVLIGAGLDGAVVRRSARAAPRALVSRTVDPS